jgi:plastocyanin
MAQRFQLALLAAAVALSLMVPADALAWPGPGLYDYTGVLLPGASIPPPIPSTWITPNYVFDYQVPRVVYVPVAVPVAAQLPAFEPVQVASISLQHGSAPAEVRVRAGTVITWRNSENQDQTLVVAASAASAPGGTDSSHSWRVPARGSFSLVVHQPGTYDYISHSVGTRLEAADQWARLIVTE